MYREKFTQNDRNCLPNFWLTSDEILLGLPPMVLSLTKLFLSCYDVTMSGYDVILSYNDVILLFTAACQASLVVVKAPSDEPLAVCMEYSAVCDVGWSVTGCYLHRVGVEGPRYKWRGSSGLCKADNVSRTFCDSTRKKLGQNFTYTFVVDIPHDQSASSISVTISKWSNRKKLTDIKAFSFWTSYFFSRQIT